MNKKKSTKKRDHATTKPNAKRVVPLTDVQLQQVAGAGLTFCTTPWD